MNRKILIERLNWILEPLSPDYPDQENKEYSIVGRINQLIKDIETGAIDVAILKRQISESEDEVLGIFSMLIERLDIIESCIKEALSQGQEMQYTDALIRRDEVNRIIERIEKKYNINWK